MSTKQYNLLLNKTLIGTTMLEKADVAMGVAMTTDNITQISIDNSGRLCIFPATQKFVLIYRSATEVHWENQQSFLYSPNRREWSYYDWFTHITKVIKDECNCELLITGETMWLNIPEKLKQQIIQQ